VNLVGEVVNFDVSIRIAQLVLKNRPKRNQRQRIIVIVYNQIYENILKLQALGNRLRKNGIAVDIVNLGVETNMLLLQTFVDAVNNEENSNLLNIEIGGRESISERVLSITINTSLKLDGNYHVIIDPELLEVIRQSFEEWNRMMQEALERNELRGLSQDEIVQRAIALSIDDSTELSRSPDMMEAIEFMLRAEETMKRTLLDNRRYFNKLIESVPETTEEDLDEVHDSTQKKEEKKENDHKNGKKARNTIQKMRR
jgi:26S proteasome regulatory subunit N10